MQESDNIINTLQGVIGNVEVWKSLLENRDISGFKIHSRDWNNFQIFQ